MSHFDTLPEPEVQLGADPSQPWQHARHHNCDLEKNTEVRQRGKEDVYSRG